jgi:hypothetical protein
MSRLNDACKCQGVSDDLVSLAHSQMGHMVESSTANEPLRCLDFEQACRKRVTIIGTNLVMNG